MANERRNDGRDNNMSRTSQSDTMGTGSSNLAGRDNISTETELDTYEQQRSAQKGKQRSDSSPLLSGSLAANETTNASRDEQERDRVIRELDRLDLDQLRRQERQAAYIARRTNQPLPSPPRDARTELDIYEQLPPTRHRILPSRGLSFSTNPPARPFADPLQNNTETEQDAYTYTPADREEEQRMINDAYRGTRTSQYFSQDYPGRQSHRYPVRRSSANIPSDSLHPPRASSLQSQSNFLYTAGSAAQTARPSGSQTGRRRRESGPATPSTYLHPAQSQYRQTPNPSMANRRHSSIIPRPSSESGMFPTRPNPIQVQSEHQLPPWQPDEEVLSCPVCTTTFSFFNRKHHCRKCGRVVCAACSPHRITLPNAYLVCPPGDQGQIGLDLSGGTQVRLCNPCVPDPQLPVDQGLPPPYLAGTGPSQGVVNARLPPIPVVGSARQPNPPLSHAHPSRTNPQPHYRSMLDITTPVPRPPRNEADFCPVCSMPLPARTLPNFEAAREQHIIACISRRMGGSSVTSQPPASSSQPNQASTDQPRRQVVEYALYTASEKDTTDRDGNEVECLICFEEVEIGARMARLKCLCTFHRDCIVDWLGRGEGKCPTHGVLGL